jgi:hypothetical protein
VIARIIPDRIASAIAARDVDALRQVLAADFFHRSREGGALRAPEFLRAISEIPGDIQFIRLEDMHVDICGAGGLATGIQHARVVIDGRTIDDRRGFVDWFVNDGGEWKLQGAVDVPTEPLTTTRD